MTKASRESVSEQFDMFLPYIADLPLRDQREMMERPFFSLAKSKRVKPIDYRSPDGKLWVHVSANPEFGMATIWDADILIYCASVLADMARRGRNDIPRKLHVMPYDILRAIGRPTTGRAYELLGQSLDRLATTAVKTNIRAESRRETTFGWLDGWTQLVDERTERSRGMTIELSSWFWEGVLMKGGVLSIDREYFSLTGGRERWLYKVARKHAGGAGEGGFAISMPTLFEKSGAEGQYRRFKYEVLKLAAKNTLPGYALTVEDTDRQEPLIRMCRRAEGLTRSPSSRIPMHAASMRTAGKKITPPPATVSEPLIDASTVIRGAIGALSGQLSTRDVTPETLTKLRADYPGWDYRVLHESFRAWIATDSNLTPVNYQSAFIGFVKRYHAKHGHELGR